MRSFTFRGEDELVDAIDRVRGDVPRVVWMRRWVEQHPEIARELDAMPSGSPRVANPLDERAPQDGSGERDESRSPSLTASRRVPGEHRYGPSDDGIRYCELCGYAEERRDARGARACSGQHGVVGPLRIQDRSVSSVAMDRQRKLNKAKGM